MVKVSTGKSNFTNLTANSTRPEYATHNIVPAQGKIETVDFDLLKEEVKDWGNDIETWWENKAEPFIENISKKTGEALEKTGATISTGVVSFFEGVGQFLEAGVDLLALAGTGLASVGTGVYDGYQAIKGKITGEQWESLTKKMWGDTKEFVATERVKSKFDEFYENNEKGQWMKENSLWFDSVRGIGSGIGYVTGVIGISVLTFGTGGIAIGGTSAAAGTVTAGQLATTAGLTGFSRGTERAWVNGADIVEGLEYGTLSGLWEGLQFFVGAKISAPGGFGDQIASKFMNNSLLAGSLARVTLDGATGGAEGFMQPLLDLVYKDSYKDANGNDVEFTDDMTFKDKYKEAFDDAGGWQNVGIQTAIGTGMSSFGEFGNLRNILAPEGKNQIQIEKLSDEVFDTPQQDIKIETNNKIDYKTVIEETTGIRQDARQYGAPTSIYDSKLFDIKSADEIMKIYNVDEISANRMIDLQTKYGLTESDAKTFIDVYKKGTEVAQNKYIGFFKNFREHTFLHTAEVADYTMKIFKDVPGIANSEKKTLEAIYGALCHDFGMKGGYQAVLDNQGNIIGYRLIDQKVDGTMHDVANLKNTDLKLSKELAEIARKNHPLNSAITVITENVLPDNVDKDVVAILAMSHSKSTSGIKHFSSREEWKKCIDNLDNAIKQYNIDNNTDFKLDTDKLYKIIENPKEFEILQDQALAIRDGDAMSVVPVDEHNRTIMQTDAVSEVKVNRQRKGYDDPISENYKQEILDLDIRDSIIKNGETTQLDQVEDAFSIKIHEGELNVKFDSRYKNKNYIAVANLVNANNSPNCTFEAIIERIGEVATYDNCKSREFIIKLPREAQGTKLGEWYENTLNSYKEKQLSKALDNSDDSLLNFFDGDGTSGSIRVVYEGTSIKYLTENFDITKEAADKIIKFYSEGMDAAKGKYNGFFKAYREHAVLHTTEVTKYTKSLIEKIPEISNSKIKTMETIYGALCHDLGMKGGYYTKEITLEDGTIKFEFKKVDDGVDLSKLTEEQSKNLANKTRKNHPLNSALTILTEDILPDGVDKNVVALLAMSHSKSTSGIRHFNSQIEWNKCIDKLDEALKQYNIDNKTNYVLDTKLLKEKIANPKEFKILQDQALAIRDGDAMSDVVVDEYGRTIMQTDTASEIIIKNPRTDYNDPISNNYKQEIKDTGISDTIYAKDGTILKLNTEDDLFSVKIHTGELNVKFDSEYKNGNYSAVVNLKDANNSPNCTFDAIDERIGEVATYDNCKTREFVIKLPKEAEGTVLGNWYEKKLIKYKAQHNSEAIDINDDILADFYDGDARSGMIRIVYQ